MLLEQFIELDTLKINSKKTNYWAEEYFKKCM